MPVTLLALTWLKSISTETWLNIAKWIAIVIGIIVAISFYNKAVDSVKEFFGFETKATLQEKLDKTNEVIATIKDANIELTKSVDVAIKVGDQATKAVEQVTKANQETRNIVTKIKTTVDTKVAVATTDQEREEANIDAVWDAYCQLNPNSRCTIS
jgi:hypothetical protein